MREPDPDRPQHARADTTAGRRVPGARGERVRIRAATARDARGLQELMEGIYAEGRWFVGDGAPTAEALARRIRGADPDGDLWLVAAEGDALLGWSELHKMMPRRMRHVAVLTIAVDAGARGRGLGRALLRGTYAWARRAGVRRIRLDVRAGNEAAVGLYESEGFVLEGREVEQIRDAGGFEDNLLMAKFLEGPEGERHEPAPREDAEADGDAK